MTFRSPPKYRLQASIAIEISNAAAFAAVWLVLGMSPGPNAAFCVATALSVPRSTALFAPMGIALASLVHVSVAAIGAGTIFANSPSAFLTLKWLGVAYLALLGVRQIRSSGNFLINTETAPTRGEIIWRGMIVSLSNPKAILQYAAVLPQFVTSDGSAVVQFAILGVIAVPIVLTNYTIYTLAASRVSAYLNPQRTIALQRGIGVIYLLAAGLLAQAVR